MVVDWSLAAASAAYIVTMSIADAKRASRSEPASLPFEDMAGIAPDARVRGPVRGGGMRCNLVAERTNRNVMNAPLQALADDYLPLSTPR
jgi:hypothetical protein